MCGRTDITSRQILLGWDHLRLYIYFMICTLRGVHMAFQFLLKGKANLLCVSPLFNIKVSGHFAPVMRCLVTCGCRKFHHTKLMESRGAHVLYSRLQMIYSISVSKTVIQICRYLSIFVNLWQWPWKWVLGGKTYGSFSRGTPFESRLVHRFPWLRFLCRFRHFLNLLEDERFFQCFPTNLLWIIPLSWAAVNNLS